MASSQSQGRCVFVGNIPYDASEEQLIQICEEVGPVVSFRLVTDRETGKPKGYGFCEYKDEETARSARRNLQTVEINGRKLRVDYAENDKNSSDRAAPRPPPAADHGGRGGGPGISPSTNVLGRHPTLHQPVGDSVALAAATVMAGALGAAQTATPLDPMGFQTQSLLGTDPLTRYLAKLSRTQLTEIVSKIKAMATQNKEQTRQLLLTVPSLPKALFQAEIMLGIVSPQMLQMPNIRQASAQPLQPLVQSAQILPGLPPLPQNVGLLPQGSQVSTGVPNQYAAIQHFPTQSQIQRPQLVQNPVLQQGSQLLGASSLPSVPPQLVHNQALQQGQHIYASTSSSLNQQVQPPLLQNLGRVPSANSGNNGQPISQTSTSHPSMLIRPEFSATGYQPSSSLSSAMPVKIEGHSSSFPVQEMDRALKMVKLNNGRATPSSQAVNITSIVPAPSSTSNLPGRQTSSVTGTPNSEKQVPQMQLPVDVDATLLQQVLNLTPEQLSSLPREQQQEVIQLQQMLRKAT